MYHITAVTLFPELFPGPLGASLTGRALEEGLWTLDTVNIRDFATDRHKTVDDTPYGGGAGMLLKPDLVHQSLEKALSLCHKERRMIYLSPKGRPLNQDLVHSLAKHPQGFVVLCGRYEGIDQRVIDHWELEEISLGDFILTGGELAAFPLIDAVIRLQPNVIGSADSLGSESFENGLLEYPQYTRPQIWHGKKVPDVLLSGHHENIAAWRHSEAEQLTKTRRPDLWEVYKRKQGVKEK